MMVYVTTAIDSTRDPPPQPSQPLVQQRLTVTTALTPLQHEPREHVRRESASRGPLWSRATRKDAGLQAVSA